MSGGVLSRSGWLRGIRARGAGIVRLLLLAFALQLAVPLFNVGGIAALAGEAAFQADLQSSLCHDGKVDAAPDDVPVPSAQTKHCVFCLPMAGDPATAGFAAQPPIPASTEITAAHVADDQVPQAARPAFARSRAPPSTPRTV
ncbi:conserved protein of unknown function [Magnetospirillum sp. XM-1]|uniref:DUF2946 family protein n=1 Tax=Magnetospirillum sp. XM-1 TaxID=1663591 RepID=UPI00073E0E9E|nr:DUF2946 family protein [Magnetospirillum sp. XM-1]CUW41461.1 conserved protein of unknown function [Magnetospirillum sp. XM-1]